MEEGISKGGRDVQRHGLDSDPEIDLVVTKEKIITLLITEK